MADLLTSAEVAAMLGKRVREVQRLARRGRLPVALKLPGVTGAYLFNPDDVADQIQGRDN